VSVNDVPPKSSDSAATVELLRSLAGLGRALFDAAACSVALLEPSETHLRYVAAVGVGADEIVGVRLPVNRGIAGWVVSSGQPIGVADVQSDVRFDKAVAESTGYVPRTILAVPLEGPEGDPLGVIQVLDPGQHGDRDDMTLLGVLAAHAERCLSVAGSGQEQRDTTAPSGDLDALVGDIRELKQADRDTAIQLLSTFIAHTRR
jgi:signal transduction protein with GAF and PtsI domain